MDEYITGYYVRAERAGRYQSLDIACLTKEELHEFLIGQGEERAIMWVQALVGWIQCNTQPADQE
jgi:hypothetical protein